jgi:hypothetical protein
VTEFENPSQRQSDASARVVPHEDIARFCGPWSVPSRTVRLAVGVLACHTESLLAQARERVAAYTAEVRALVAELEEKLPQHEKLPFWRELLVFYERAAVGWHLPPLLPVIVDPSHAGGRTDLVAPLAYAAVAAGADGLIIEVHPRPTEALSDGDQSLSPEAFLAVMRGIRPFAEAAGRELPIPADLAVEAAA